MEGGIQEKRVEGFNVSGDLCLVLIEWMQNARNSSDKCLLGAHMDGGRVTSERIQGFISELGWDDNQVVDGDADVCRVEETPSKDRKMNRGWPTAV